MLTPPTTTEQSIFDDPQEIVETLHTFEVEVRVLLLLSDDLYELYEEALSKRLHIFDFPLTIAHSDYPEENLKSFDYVLRFHCPPSTSEDDSFSQSEESKEDIFEVQGGPPLENTNPFKRDEFFLTEIDQRLLDLQALTDKQEQDIHFKQLAQGEWSIRQKLLVCQQYQQKVDQLNEKISEVESSYYEGINLLLMEALEKSAQLNTLAKVMKRFTKILIIDGQDKHTQDQVVALGFSRKNLSYMSFYSFNQLHKEFIAKYQESHPGEITDLKEFFLKGNVFDQYDIILYNNWDFKQNQLNVGICVKQWPQLSRKEQSQVNRKPDQQAQELESLEDACQKLQIKLKNTQEELTLAEAQGNLPEHQYQNLERKRKREALDLKRKLNRLKQLHKTVSIKKTVLFYTHDLIQSIKSQMTFAQRLDKTIANWHDLGELLPHKQNKKKDKVANLLELITYVQKKQKIEQTIQKLNHQVKAFLKKIEQYAQHHFSSDTHTYQQMIGIHTLNCLEKHVLGCGIAHVNQLVHIYSGSYFQVEGVTAEEWEDELLEEIDICIVSKTNKLPTQVLEHVFQIDEDERVVRLHYSSTFPEAHEFHNKEFDLLIINYSQYASHQMFECLKRRNGSPNPHIPVLILTPSNYQLDFHIKLRFDLLIGVDQDSEGNINLNPPPYLIDSLTTDTALIEILSTIMGIPPEGIPPFEEEEKNEKLTSVDSQHQSAFSSAFSSTSSSEHQQTKAPLPKNIGISSQPHQEMDDTDELDLISITNPRLEKGTEQIQLTLPKEEIIEVYTTSSLFGFEDETSVPEKKVKDSEATEQEEETEKEKETEQEEDLEDTYDLNLF